MVTSERAFIPTRSPTLAERIRTHVEKELAGSQVVDLHLWELLVRALGGGRFAQVLACLCVVLGLGLLNKTSMPWFGGGAALGILLTSHRRVLLTRGPWLAAALAGLLFLPHVVWQVQNGWPTLEFTSSEPPPSGGAAERSRKEYLT